MKLADALGLVMFAYMYKIDFTDDMLNLNLAFSSVCF